MIRARWPITFVFLLILSVSIQNIEGQSSCSTDQITLAYQKWLGSELQVSIEPDGAAIHIYENGAIFCSNSQIYVLSKAAYDEWSMQGRGSSELGNPTANTITVDLQGRPVEFSKFSGGGIWYDVQNSHTISILASGVEFEAAIPILDPAFAESGNTVHKEAPWLDKLAYFPLRLIWESSGHFENERFLVPAKNNEYEVLVELKPDANLAELSKFAKLQSQYENQYIFDIPLENFGWFFDNPGVISGKTPTEPIPNQAVLAGSQVIGTETVKSAGLDGRGIQVAVIDLAFDVPSANEKKSFRKSFGTAIPIEGNGFEKIHGNAVVEILRDIAPATDVRLYAIGNEVEFVQAIDYIIKSKKDTDVILMSLGWLNYPSDGSSKMTKKIEEAIDAGMNVVISAGNAAETHYERAFVDSNGNRLHEFDSNDETLDITVGPQKDPIIIYLLWSGSNDFNLILEDKDKNVLAESRNNQERGAVKNFEYISYKPTYSGTYTIKVESASSSSTSKIELFSPIASNKFEYYDRAGSVGVPQDARKVITTGAIKHSNYKTAPAIQPYSAQGPTNRGDSVPTLTAPDGFLTTSYGKSSFDGTSAAAPHSAGVLALLLQAKQMSAAEARELLIAKTIKDVPFASAAPDNTYGYGKLDATFIADYAKTKTQSKDTPATSKETTSIKDPVTEVLPKKPTSKETHDNTDQDSMSNYDQVSQLSVLGEYPVPTYKKQIQIPLEGKVPEYKKALSVELTIRKPDGKIETLHVTPKSNGEYHTSFTILHDSPPGLYTISAKYDSITLENYNIRVGKAGVPEWVKSSAGWWAKGVISDSDFVQGIQFLIKEGIMKIPPTVQGAGGSQNTIPEWVKSSAGWWAKGVISDSDFVQGIQFLIKEGIMKVVVKSPMQQSVQSPGIIQQNYGSMQGQTLQADCNPVGDIVTLPGGHNIMYGMVSGPVSVGRDGLRLIFDIDNACENAFGVNIPKSLFSPPFIVFLDGEEISVKTTEFVDMTNIETVLPAGKMRLEIAGNMPASISKNTITISKIELKDTAGQIVNVGTPGSYATPWISIKNSLQTQYNVDFDYVWYYQSDVIQTGSFSVSLTPGTTDEFWCPCGMNFEKSGEYRLNLSAYSPLTKTKVDAFVAFYNVTP